MKKVLIFLSCLMGLGVMGQSFKENKYANDAIQSAIVNRCKDGALQFGKVISQKYLGNHVFEGKYNIIYLDDSKGIAYAKVQYAGKGDMEIIVKNWKILEVKFTDK